MHRKVSQTSHSVAKLAELPRRTVLTTVAAMVLEQDSCTMQCAQNAEDLARFRSSHAMIALFTAATALEDKSCDSLRKMPMINSSVFFCKKYATKRSLWVNTFEYLGCYTQVR